jgi:arsenate reductase-like glutaredoxin family protein
MIRFPKLIQRPIVLWADRAVVARPLELLIDAITDAD